MLAGLVCQFGRDNPVKDRWAWTVGYRSVMAGRAMQPGEPGFDSGMETAVTPTNRPCW